MITMTTTDQQWWWWWWWWSCFITTVSLCEVSTNPHIKYDNIWVRFHSRVNVRSGNKRQGFRVHQPYSLHSSQNTLIKSVGWKLKEMNSKETRPMDLQALVVDLSQLSLMKIHMEFPYMSESKHHLYIQSSMMKGPSILPDLEASCWWMKIKSVVKRRWAEAAACPRGAVKNEVRASYKI